MIKPSESFFFPLLDFVFKLFFISEKSCSPTVIDVVRTDSHLDFYKDTKNLARMSDILAVYAWVDPTTGYCQGGAFIFWVEPLPVDNLILKYRLKHHVLLVT